MDKNLLNKTKEKLNYIYVLKFLSAIVIAIFLHWNDHILRNIDQANILESRALLFLTTKTYVLAEFFFLLSGVLFYVASLTKMKKTLNLVIL